MAEHRIYDITRGSNRGASPSKAVLGRGITIRERIAGTAFVLLLLMSATTVTFWLGFSSLAADKSLDAGLAETATELQRVVGSVTTCMLTEGSADSRGAVHYATEGFLKSYRATVELAGEGRLASTLSGELWTEWETFQTRLGPVLTRVQISHDDGPTIAAFRNALEAAEGAAQVLKAARADVSAGSRASARRMVLAAGAAAGITLLVSGILFSLLYRSIARPIALLAKTANQAAGRDLSDAFRKGRRDEIGVLSDAFESTTRGLRNVLGNLRSLSEHLSAHFQTASLQAEQASTRISNTIATQHSAVNRVATLVQEMDNLTADVTANTEKLAFLARVSSDASTEMCDSAESVTRQATDYGRAAKTAAEEVGRSLCSTRDMFDNLQLCTASAEEIEAVVVELESVVADVEAKARESTDKAKAVSAKASERGTTSVRAAVEGMGRIERCVTSLSATVNGLGERSQEIGKILGFIDEVAKRTSLLSLNAAILAVQAGEHGKSFGVVAEEIRGLAEKTSKSTKDIAKVVSRLQSDVTKSVELTSVGLLAVREGIDLVGEVELALDQIRDDSELAARMSDRILDASADQTQSVRAIADGVRTSTQALESLAAQARAQEDANRSLLDTVTAIGASSDDVIHAVARQIQTTDEISRAAAKIAENASEISGRMAGQRQSSASIVSAVGDIESGTQDLLNQMSDLRHSITELGGEADRILAEIHRFAAD